MVLGPHHFLITELQLLKVSFFSVSHSALRQPISPSAPPQLPSSCSYTAAAKIYGIDPGRGGRRTDRDPRKAQVRGKAPELINEMNLQGRASLDNENATSWDWGRMGGEGRVLLSVGRLRREIGVTLLPGGKQRWGEKGLLIRKKM